MYSRRVLKPQQYKALQVNLGRTEDDLMASDIEGLGAQRFNEILGLSDATLYNDITATAGGGLKGRNYRLDVIDDPTTPDTRANPGVPIGPISNDKETDISKKEIEPGTGTGSGNGSGDGKGKYTPPKYGNRGLWDPIPAWQAGQVGVAFGANNSMKHYVYNPISPYRHDGRVEGDQEAISIAQTQGNEIVRRMSEPWSSNLGR
jgi:hypothetical protein